MNARNKLKARLLADDYIKINTFSEIYIYIGSINTHIAVHYNIHNALKSS